MELGRHEGKAALTVGKIYEMREHSEDEFVVTSNVDEDHFFDYDDFEQFFEFVTDTNKDKEWTIKQIQFKITDIQELLNQLK